MTSVKIRTLNRLLTSLAHLSPSPLFVVDAMNGKPAAFFFVSLTWALTLTLFLNGGDATALKSLADSCAEKCPKGFASCEYNSKNSSVLCHCPQNQTAVGGKCSGCVEEDVGAFRTPSAVGVDIIESVDDWKVCREECRLKDLSECQFWTYNTITLTCHLNPEGGLNSRLEAGSSLAYFVSGWRECESTIEVKLSDNNNNSNNNSVLSVDEEESAESSGSNPMVGFFLGEEFGNEIFPALPALFGKPITSETLVKFYTLTPLERITWVRPNIRYKRDSLYPGRFTS